MILQDNQDFPSLIPIQGKNFITIIECSRVINESKDTVKVPSPSNDSFLNFINPFVLIIVEKKTLK